MRKGTHWTRFTEAQVRSCRRAYADGWTVRQLATLLHKRPQAMSMALRGVTFGDLPGAIPVLRPTKAARAHGRPSVPGRPRDLGNPAAKLDEDAVLAIRTAAAGESQSALAARYGVRPVAISRVLRRLTWKHVGGPAAPVRRRTKLDPDQVAAIRAAAASGETSRALAARFGVNEGTIRRIRSGQTGSPSRRRRTRPDRATCPDMLRRLRSFPDPISTVAKNAAIRFG